jgi:cytoskeletal protein CcmA (bactofilin family)
MFEMKSKKEEQVSIINRNSSVDGLLDSKGHLIVEGTISGRINAESVFTERESHLTAKVSAISISIAGFFEGEIEAHTLTLLNTANASGDIRCHKLIVDEGAIFNGSVQFISQDLSQEDN